MVGVPEGRGRAAARVTVASSLDPAVRMTREKLYEAGSVARRFGAGRG